jgi:hypothetical protein
MKWVIGFAISYKIESGWDGELKDWMVIYLHDIRFKTIDIKTCQCLPDLTGFS